MKVNSKIKLVTLSVSLLMSVNAMAGLGGLRVNSGLGQPFSASVTVTGEEAKELLNGGKVSLSDSRLRASVQKSGNNAIVNIRTSSAINDPVMIFQMGVGSQARQYTAIIDPPGYRAGSNGRANNGNNNAQATPEPTPSTNQTQSASSNNRMPVLVQPSTGVPSSASSGSSEAAEPSSGSSTSQAAEQSNTQRQQAAPSAKLKRGSRYQAKSGETLNAIAAKARPSGLSLEETKRAIIRANPHLFRKGNVNRALTGASLYIPTTTELNRLGRRPVQAHAPAGAAVPMGVPSQDVNEPSTTDNETTASAPTAPAASAAASEAAPQAAIASATAASSAASDVASEAVASEASVVVQAVQPPVVEQQPMPDEAIDDGIPWQAIVFGSVGLVALLILLKILSKRKAGAGKAKPAPEGEETDPFKPRDGIRTHQPVAQPSNPQAPLTKAEAAALMAAEAEKEAENFDDDDIFFTEVANVNDAKNEFDDFNLDALDLDKQQAGIVSSAITNDKETKSRQNADWDKIESTESVFEPDEFDDIKPASQPAAAVSLSKPSAASDDFNLDDFDIDINQTMPTAGKPAAPAAEVSLAKPVAASDDFNLDDFDIDINQTMPTAGKPAAPAAEVSLAKPAATSDDFNLDDFDIDINQTMPTAGKPAAPAAEVSLAKPAAAQDDFNLDDFYSDVNPAMSAASKPATPEAEPVIEFEPLDFSHTNDLSSTTPAKPVVEEPKEPERISWASSTPREPSKPVFFDLAKDHPEPIVIQTGNNATPAKPAVAPVVQEPVQEKAAEVKPAPILEPKPKAPETLDISDIQFDSFELAVEKPATPVVEPVVEKPAAPVVEPVVEKPVAPVVEPVVEKPVAPVVEPVVEKPVAPVVEPVVEKPVAPVVEPVVEKPAAPVVEPVVEKPVAPVVESVVEKPAAPVVEPVVEKPAAPVVEPMVEKPVVMPVFDAVELEEVQPAAKPVAEKPAPSVLDFEVETPEIPEPVVMQTVAPKATPVAPAPEPTIATVGSTDIAGFSLLEETKSDEVVSQPVVDNTLSWGNGDDDMDVVAVEAVAAEAPTSAVEWGDIQVEVGSSHVTEPGFVSESVGMTAPLEAKYELAEMYIEIGDPDAARETLFELIEESTGEIQAKSQALLNTLN